MNQTGCCYSGHVNENPGVVAEQGIPGVAVEAAALPTGFECIPGKALADELTLLFALVSISSPWAVAEVSRVGVGRVGPLGAEGQVGPDLADPAPQLCINRCGQAPRTQFPLATASAQYLDVTGALVVVLHLPLFFTSQSCAQCGDAGSSHRNDAKDMAYLILSPLVGCCFPCLTCAIDLDELNGSIKLLHNKPSFCLSSYCYPPKLH